jgi:glycosyltransferase involved in cell wall biosynthesis
MIVKNEEKFIKTCLESAFHLADNAVIVDTGSTDNTKNILKEFGSKVTILEYKWKNDFAAARNESLKHADGDWILVLDGDQKLICNCGELRKKMMNTNLNGLIIPAYNLLDNNEIVYSTEHFNIFKNRGYIYENSIHECLNLNNDGIIENCIIDDKLCYILHFGYLKNEMKDKDKIMRNLEILKKEYEQNPNNPFNCYNLGVCLVNLTQYENALDCFIRCHELCKKEGLTLYYNDVLRNIGECLYKLKQYDNCISFIREVIKVDLWREFLDLYFIMANCYVKKGEYDKAINLFNKCISIGEKTQIVSIYGRGSFISKLMIARIYAFHNNVSEAITRYMEAIFDPNNIMKQGVEEVRKYLKNNELDTILQEFNKLIGG